MDNSMLVKDLPSYLVIKGFVFGDPDCNYELYLRELLNASSWFAKEHPGEFIAPVSESHGECDAFNDNYAIDFKLFDSETHFQSQSLQSQSIQRLSEDLISYGAAREPGITIDVTILHTVFRTLDMGDLLDLEEYTSDVRSVRKDIAEALDTLRVKKNILLFFPFEFLFEEDRTDAKALDSITMGLNSDFDVAFEYRSLRAPNFDTFFTCIYQDRFALFKVENCALSFLEWVECAKLNTYIKLIEDYED